MRSGLLQEVRTMTKQSTVDKLIEMRLKSMSDGFITQMDDPKMKDVSFEDRFGLLVDIEYNNRKSNSLKPTSQISTTPLVGS